MTVLFAAVLFAASRRESGWPLLFLFYSCVFLDRDGTVRYAGFKLDVYIYVCARTRELGLE